MAGMRSGVLDVKRHVATRISVEGMRRTYRDALQKEYVLRACALRR
jgi:hypothetical protein